MSALGLDMDNTWARLGRLKEAGLGLNVGLFTTDAAWTAQGIDPGTLGLLDLGPAIHDGLASGRLVQVPVLPNLLIDLHVHRTARVVSLVPGDGTEPQVLVEGGFHDDHPNEWVDELFTELRATLVVAPRGAEDFTTGAAWMDTWRVGVVGVLRRMTSDGIGII